MAAIVRTRKWKRPSDEAPFPKVWHTFAATGSKCGRKISIRDMLPEECDEVWDMYKKHFFWNDEAICGEANIIVDDESMASRKLIFDHIVGQGVSVVAVLNGNGDSKPSIVGCSLLEVSDKDDPPFPRLPGDANAKIERALHLAEVDVFGRLDADYLLTNHGIAVKREFRALNVDKELFRNMELIARTFRLPGTRIALTGPTSKKLCAHLDFTKFNEVRLIDCEDENGRLLFPTASPDKTIWYGYLDCTP